MLKRKNHRGRRRAGLQSVELLENRRLLAVAMLPPELEGDHAADHAEHIGDDGNVMVKCLYNSASVGQLKPMAPMAPVAPLVDTFKLHSLPSATKRIYLDFDGHVTAGTAWQGGASFTTPAFSLDADYATFNSAEKEAIQEVWARVSEDFFPFNVDVTTEEPPIDDLRKTGPGDDRWGMRVVIGGKGEWMAGAAGVAYIGSFNWDTDTPCFVFADQWWKNDLNFMATAASHETGHTLGLGHDGYNGNAYYGGRGTGETSWGPIMGNPGGKISLTQWSKGDYGGSTNKQDDLAIITGSNGFGYRPDDHGDTAATATVAPGPDFEIGGFIGSSSDVDMFRFTTTGQIQATISPLSVGANLDILAALLDSAGNTVATSNPIDKIGASFTLTVSPGTYYLSVRGTGMGNVNTTGYTDYGSLGQYTVKVGNPSGPTPSLSVADVVVEEGNAGTTTATVTVRLSNAATTAVTVTVATADGTATAGSGDYTAGSAMLSFAIGETEKTFVVQVRGDTKVEPDETILVRLSNATGATIGDGEGVVTVRNDDQPPSLSLDDITIIEGNSGTRNANFVVRLSGPMSKPVKVDYATKDGSATVADADYIAVKGTITFLPGETVKTIIVLVRSDARVEGDETFSFGLSNATNAPISRAVAVATVRDDDVASGAGQAPGSAPAPTVSIADAKTIEGHVGIRLLTFVVSLSSPATDLATVRYRTVGRTATAGDDFLAASGELRFARGMSSQTVQVMVRGDQAVEADETLAVELFDARGLTLGRAAAVGTIVNDDVAPKAMAAAAMAWASLDAQPAGKARK